MPNTRPIFHFPGIYPLGIFLVSAILANTATGAMAVTGNIRLNQVGFYSQGPKKAAVVGSSSVKFHILSVNLADTLFTGTLGAESIWAPSQENARTADFGAFTQEGEFVLAVADLGYSHPFRINKRVHRELLKAAIKAYYFNRASTELLPAHAGKWARAAGHPDRRVVVHSSAASPGRPSGTLISSPRGWYDAGDYGKYVVNSGITTYTLLALYQHFPTLMDSLELNIPESGNGIPDILDEALWNIRWMMSMQDPADGGVYHKLTTADFSGSVMPDGDRADRFVVQKSTAATLDFAAVMAQTARIFRSREEQMPGLADSALQAAQKAWSWARSHPAVFFDQAQMNKAHSPAINTGAYGDSRVADEFLWAGTELFLTTGQDSFFLAGNNGSTDLAASYGVPGWPSVGSLGLYSLRLPGSHSNTARRTAANEKILVAAQALALRQQGSSFAVSMSPGDFYWGSNSVAANQGMLMLQAFIASGDSGLLHAALGNLDYLLGRNGTGYCFVTGFGGKPTKFPHHRPSEADKVEAPVPGFLAGGPNPGQQDKGGCAPYPSPLPALSYLDHQCSYASNEVAINWNAPLVYLAGALEAIYSGQGNLDTLSANLSFGKRKYGTSSPARLPALVRNGVLELTLPQGWQGKIAVLDLAGKAKAQARNNGLRLFLELPSDTGLALIRLDVNSADGKALVYTGKFMNRDGSGSLLRSSVLKPR